MKQPASPSASCFHHGFLTMAPGWAIRFVCGIGSKGSVMLAQKGRLASRAKMRDAGRDAEIGGVE
jgi:hypothetical protein